MLSIVATPIGNQDDITIRAIKTLFAADAIMAEDTRHTGLFMQELVRRWGSQFNLASDWKPAFIPYYDEIEEKKLPEVIGLLEEGKHLALVSDAGTPLISDPGFRIVRECLRRNIQVESIPGPSAVIAALTSSGLPADKFLFLGYPPEKEGQRVNLFELLKTSFTNKHLSPTIIFYCAPHKLVQTLHDLQQTFGDIEIVLARELTKIHEETWRGTLSEAIIHFAEPKGELVLLFH